MKTLLLPLLSAFVLQACAHITIDDKDEAGKPVIISGKIDSVSESSMKIYHNGYYKKVQWVPDLDYKYKAGEKLSMRAELKPNLGILGTYKFLSWVDKDFPKKRSARITKERQKLAKNCPEGGMAPGFIPAEGFLSLRARF